MVARDALEKLIEAGLLPGDPFDELELESNTDVVILCVERTYGAARDGRLYKAAVIGYKDMPELPSVWTVSGGAPQTPRNVGWPEFLVWLTSPSKSKWRIWFSTELEEMGSSRELNKALYLEEKNQ
jgi:hypothetical protein